MDGREQTIGSIEMLLTLGFIFTFIAKSSQLEMNSRLYGRVGAKGLNLLCQQRNVRIMNSFKRAPESSTPPKSSTSLSALEDANGETITNPKMAFVNAILASFKRKDAQKLFICENKHIAHDGSTAKGIKSVTGRLVEIKAGLRLQLVYRCLTTDITKNLELHEVENAINDILAEGFKRATFSSSIETHDLSLRRGSGNLRVTAAENPEEAEEEVNLQHDRKKNVPIDSQAQFLKALKVTTEGGRPSAGMANKYRQIQKFVEILGGLVDRSEGIKERVAATVAENFAKSSVTKNKSTNVIVSDMLTRKTPLRVVDMGSGMAYLTFSAHHHLFPKFDIETIGVEARDHLVSQTNSIAMSLGDDYNGLSFIEGSILDYFSLDLPGRRKPVAERVVVKEGDENEASGESWDDRFKKAEKVYNKRGKKHLIEKNKMDVLIALHACDTATDDAIWCGIQGGAQIIVTAPCCHKEVRGQIDKHVATAPATDTSGSGSGNGNGVMELLQHGIYRERKAEMVTDTLRALILERCGYTTTVFEFVGGEHTAKNVMIAAVKRSTIPELSASASSAANALARAKEVLAGIQAADRAKRSEKKKKFQSVSVNEFGDVDVDSYEQKEGKGEEEMEGESSLVVVKKRQPSEEEKKKLIEVADMIDNNDRVARMEEQERQNAISRRIQTVMKSFGVKNLKLLDLVAAREMEVERTKAFNMRKIASLSAGDAAEDEEEEEEQSGVEHESVLDPEEEKKIKKQLKMRRFRR